MLKKPNDPVFLRLDECVDYCNQELQSGVSLQDIESLVEAFLLPVFAEGSTQQVLTQDLRSLLPVISNSAANTRIPLIGRTLFSTRIPAELRPSPHVKIEMSALDNDIAPAFYAGVRNLASQIPPSFLGH